MKSKLILMIVMAAISLVLFACGSSSAPKMVSVDSSDSGKEVKVAAGGSLQVILESNQTTGFQWELTSISAPTVLEKVDQKFITMPPDATKDGSPLVGAPGAEVWTFTALQKGNSTISMGYSRPWESVPPVKTFVLTVSVK